MIQPNELRSNLPMEVANGVISTTTKVWNILLASRKGDLYAVRKMVEECPDLIYAQYNYTPPIHFAVREGHIELTKFLLDQGAHDPTYKTYPFSDSLLTIARDREHTAIAELLEEYYTNPALCKFRGDNGEIHYNQTELQHAFQNAVDKANLDTTARMLKEHPGLLDYEHYFWGEGILMMPAKENNRELIELLVDHGAKVPDILKWAQAYYFESYDGAAFMMEKGMKPNVMSWHRVTILHDMAQKGMIQKAALLLKHGADIDRIEEEYQSTPLGLAARWGQTAMVEYLLEQGADPNKAGAPWATPLAWAIKKRAGRDRKYFEKRFLNIELVSACNLPFLLFSAVKIKLV